MDRGPDMSVLHTNPRQFARIAGVFYLLVFVFGIAALNAAGATRFAANLLAAAVYYVVTVMLYQLYKPVSPTGSLVTALFSFAALTIGVLSDFGVVRFPLNTLVLFGAYCIGLGWLTLKATFLPKAIGVLLIVAGLGWLTYVHPPLAKRLGALAMAPGMVGEGALTLWLWPQASIPIGGGLSRFKARRDEMTAAKPNRGRAISPGTHDHGMTRTALCAAADAGATSAQTAGTT